ncbi:hypothetical protein LINPERHAP2_LOCUS38599 [Linum perenne]
MSFILVLLPSSTPIEMKQTNLNDPILTKTQSTISISSSSSSIPPLCSHQFRVSDPSPFLLLSCRHPALIPL